MNPKWYILWGIVVIAALALGVTIRLPDQPASREVLSAQQYPEPAPFPVRRPGTLDPAIRAKYVILLDADSFYPLYRKEAYQEVPVASTTKMMTALVVLDRYRPDEEVTVSRQATQQIGSTTGLLPGERITVDSLLRALLIQSGNDAAYALAEHGGSVEQFVSWMNDKAKEVGMHASSFKDPAGLDDGGRSTAFELAVLGSLLMRQPKVREITATSEMTITSVDGKQTHLLKNSNRLVTPELYFPGATGIKTGFTPAAGHTLVAAAEREGRLLIGVILFTYEDTKDASARESARLLNWGFASYLWTSP